MSAISAQRLIGPLAFLDVIYQHVQFGTPHVDSMMARHKAIYFSWLGPELFLSVAWPTVVQLLVFFCSSVPMVLFDTQRITRCRSQHVVSVESSALSGKELFIRFTASAFRKLLSIYVFSYFPFGFEGRMWDLIVSVPDHCLSFYLLREELEKVQKRAARFVTSNYIYEIGSMTGILKQLKWESLKKGGEIVEL